MKPPKQITKLALNKETLRTLTSDELTKVAGGGAMGCAGRTYAGSGCSSYGGKCVLVP